MADKIAKVEAVPQQIPVKTTLNFQHYPLTPAEEADWLKTLNTDFKKREQSIAFGSVVRDVDRITCYIRLNNGTKDGKVQTINVNIGSINCDRYDDSKAVNIMELCKENNIFAKNILDMKEVKNSILANSED